MFTRTSTRTVIIILKKKKKCDWNKQITIVYYCAQKYRKSIVFYILAHRMRHHNSCKMSARKHKFCKHYITPFRSVMLKRVTWYYDGVYYYKIKTRLYFPIFYYQIGCGETRISITVEGTTFFNVAKRLSIFKLVKRETVKEAVRGL